MQTLGVIGTGHLATYLITALRRGGHRGDIVLSPRNAQRAEALARDRACCIAASSAAVLSAADVVLLSVRPHHAETAVANLAWQPHHTVLSVMAGIRLDDLRRLLPGAGQVHMIMPVSYIEAVAGPIPLYPPAPALMDLLSCAGQVVPLENEQAYEAALLAACASTWVYDLADVLATELARHGLTPEAARTLALGSIAGPAGYALERSDLPLPAISASIATDRTYTKLGLDLLKARRFDRPWREAIAAIAAKLA